MQHLSNAQKKEVADLYKNRKEIAAMVKKFKNQKAKEYALDGEALKAISNEYKNDSFRERIRNVLKVFHNSQT